MVLQQSTETTHSFRLLTGVEREGDQGQYPHLHRSNGATYPLCAVEGLEEVSTYCWSYPTRPRTGYGRSKWRTMLACNFAPIQRGYVLSVGSQTVRQYQRKVRNTTYSFLWPVEEGMRSIMFCHYPTGSRTIGCDGFAMVSMMDGRNEAGT